VGEPPLIDLRRRFWLFKRRAIIFSVYIYVLLRLLTEFTVDTSTEVLHIYIYKRLIKNCSWRVVFCVYIAILIPLSKVKFLIILLIKRHTGNRA